MAAVVHHQHHERDAGISGRLRPAPERGRRPVGRADNGGRATGHGGGDRRRLRCDRRRGELSSWSAHGGWASRCTRPRSNGRQVTVQVERIGIGYRLPMAACRSTLRVLPPRAAELLA